MDADGGASGAGDVGGHAATLAAMPVPLSAVRGTVLQARPLRRADMTVQTEGALRGTHRGER